MNLVIFRLATSCGLRVSEICGLKISDLKRLENDKPFIQIRKVISKGGKARTVPLWWDRSAMADIAAWRNYRLANGARRCVGEDRLDGLTIHHGRHSFVSHALLKRPIAAVRDAAGHSSIGTTNVYAHVLDQDEKDVGDLYERRTVAPSISISSH
jgi:integrase